MIYSRWAFDSDSGDKYQENIEEYDMLKSTYKISRSKTYWNYRTGKNEPININEYDVVVNNFSQRYGTSEYEIIKNGPGLSEKELALICDDGNLCFGYSAHGKYIDIYTE